MVNVLFLIAHPDDETIFGANDLLDMGNKKTVICFTNGSNLVRKKEFFKTMNIVEAKGIMFDFHDSEKDGWKYVTNKDIVHNDLLPIIDTIPDLIVSHDADGEYGHIQHKRVSTIAKDLSEYLHVPFQGFRKRFHGHFTNPVLRDSILTEAYTSQQGAVNAFKNFYEKSTPT